MLLTETRGAHFAAAIAHYFHDLLGRPPDNNFCIMFDVAGGIVVAAFILFLIPVSGSTSFILTISSFPRLNGRKR